MTREVEFDAKPMGASDVVISFTMDPMDVIVVLSAERASSLSSMLANAVQDLDMAGREDA